MRFASLGSGSKGNATLIECESSALLIDCGFSVRETEKRLKRLDREAESLTGILVTHEHGDHIRGVLPLARKYRLPVYMTAGTAKAHGETSSDITIIDGHSVFDCGGLAVKPVRVPHDAREPVQYLIGSGELTLGVLTDLGHISAHVATEYACCDALLLEANHDPLMLSQGPYPPSLKRRVGGEWGHLSNAQARQLLGHVELSRLQHLVLAHISEKNNCVSKVEAAVADIRDCVDALHVASQSDGFDWLCLG